MLGDEVRDNGQGSAGEAGYTGSFGKIMKEMNVSVDMKRESGNCVT